MYNDKREFYQLIAGFAGQHSLTVAQQNVVFKARKNAIEHLEINGAQFDPNTDDPIYNLAFILTQRQVLGVH